MSTSPTYPEPTQPALPYETPRSQWNATTIGAIALKILGVYCLIQTLQLVPYLMSFPGPGMSSMQTLAVLVGFGFARAKTSSISSSGRNAAGSRSRLSRAI